MNKSNSFMLGLLVGGVVGGISILLSTPKSGIELRTKIRENSHDLLDQLSHLKKEAKEFLHLAQQSTHESKEIMKDFSEDVQKTIKAWKRDIKPNQVNIQKEIDEIEKTLVSLEESLNRHQVN